MEGRDTFRVFYGYLMKEIEFIRIIAEFKGLSRVLFKFKFYFCWSYVVCFVWLFEVSWEFLSGLFSNFIL